MDGGGLLTGQGTAENDYRAIDSVLAEGYGLVHEGDGEGVDAQALQGLCDRYCAVAVGVGLDHCDDLNALGYPAFEIVEVMGQGAEIDFGAGLLKS